MSILQNYIYSREPSVSWNTFYSFMQSSLNKSGFWFLKSSLFLRCFLSKLDWWSRTWAFHKIGQKNINYFISPSSRYLEINYLVLIMLLFAVIEILLNICNFILLQKQTQYSNGCQTHNHCASIIPSLSGAVRTACASTAPFSSRTGGRDTRQLWPCLAPAQHSHSQAYAQLPTLSLPPILLENGVALAWNSKHHSHRKDFSSNS